ncbi:glycosyltransferase 87 family protein [Mycobacterium sp. ACS4331]|uniref:glycosyltransferase 87 family protein n=1 Tax=Mycobacterium sp. ACS4331 TaxID=1834121 RepID=UPI0007FC7D5E|nr:glycosyltransferase 87 family protein [Mycobacterium sp. ACS4331]OBF23784.1 alpha-(1-2)-phosphatidylinositol mannosyltransferase [Mycobacterium sp. ACS4331]
MSNRRWPGVGDQSTRGRRGAWQVFTLAALAAFGYATWRLFRDVPYRIDIDVYRMGGRAWLDERPLYSDGTVFHTVGGIDLPFTYPPLAAISFSPFAWLSLPAASIAITATTLVLLVVSTSIVLARLSSVDTPGPRWRVVVLAMALVAPAVIWLEPVRSNFDFGQINVVLMTLVIADCVPRRTPWPRGLLLGLAIALKLTPAVFLVYFVLRRDIRAVLVAFASFAGATLIGFVLAWQDSIEYWTRTVRNTDRIGTATLNTNQNISGALARLGLTEDFRFALWTLACFAVLGLTVWAGRRVLAAGEPVLALICVAMFGLVVSPVSWSHHWVWVLPTLVACAVVGWRHRSTALGLVTAVGCALMIWTPIDLLPEHQEAEAAWWRQLVGGSYVWWALAVIVAAGLTVTTRVSPRPTAEGETVPSPDHSEQALPRS